MGYSNLRKLASLMTGKERPYYNESFKERFREIGTKALEELARVICLKEYRVSFNPGGIAVSGDLILMGMWSEGNGVYISMNKDFPGKPWGDVLYRSIKHMKDYTGGPNLYFKFELLRKPVLLRETIMKLKRDNHELTISSLNDGIASCCYGEWFFRQTGKVKKSEIEKEFSRHLEGVNLKRYRVHIYAVVRVPVEVSAFSPKEAVKKADSMVDLYEFRDYDAEFAEEVVDYFVNEISEEGELLESKCYKPEQIYAQSQEVTMGYYSGLIRYNNVKTNLRTEEFYDRWEKAKESLVGTNYEGYLDIYKWEGNTDGFSLKLEEWYAKHYADWKLAEFISEVIALGTGCILEFVGEDGCFWGYYITSGKVDDIQYVKMVNGEIIE